jgi:hypothetical protein
MKIRPLGAELIHADGQTDTTKQIVAVRNFANVPKINCSASALRGIWIKEAIRTRNAPNIVLVSALFIPFGQLRCFDK